MCERDLIANVLALHGYQMRDDEDPIVAMDRMLLRQRTAIVAMDRMLLRERTALLAMQRTLNHRTSATTDAVVKANTKGESSTRPDLQEQLRSWGVVALVYILVTVIGVASIQWVVSTIARWFT